jgi:hypothetical protein
MAQQNQPTHDEIRIRAYQIYLARGGDHGMDEQDWFQAERELLAELNPRAASATAAATSAGSTLKQEPSTAPPRREAGVYNGPKAGS